MADLSLKPKFAAQLAFNVYTLTREPTVDLALSTLNRIYKGQFDFANPNLVKGKTGGPGFIKCRTAFGFVLQGKGIFEGHAIFLFRGTQYLADWLTNFNVTLRRSNFGQPIHDGFATTFATMLPQIQAFLPSVRGCTIHCIGHSLGGALATLCAEWLSADHKLNPYLYTYGSPRVGLQGFADICTREVGAKRIFRVYHRTDVVPCIPFWPFIHTPSSGSDYFIPSPGMIGGTYHSMTKYIGSMSIDNKSDHSWKSLGVLKPEQKTDSAIADWLKENTPLTLTITTMEWLNKAIVFVINKCVHGASKIVSSMCATALTLMDTLAFILAKGLNLAETVSSWVLYLMRKIMRLLGYGYAIDAADLSYEFIRNALMSLQRKVNALAKDALSRTLVKGRAI